MTTEEEQLYGRGISLKRQTEDESKYAWDLELSSDGDIKLDRGIDELEKDCSFKVRRAVTPFEGDPIIPKTTRNMEAVTRDVLQNDERIAEVISVTVEKIPPSEQENGRNDTVQISADTIAIGNTRFELEVQQ